MSAGDGSWVDLSEAQEPSLSSPPGCRLRDPVMQSLMQRYGELGLKRRSPFAALSRSIIAQQISTKAADTIRQRVAINYGDSPEAFATEDPRRLRTLGLSEAKVQSLQKVASLAIAGHFDRLEVLPDNAVIARLRTIKGVGPWTAEMFLIFCLARPDVWPMSDAGLRTAVRRLYGAINESQLEEIGQRFSPEKSIAALYLWKSLENTAND